MLDLLDQLSENATPGTEWRRPDAERAAGVWSEILSQPGRTLLVAEVDGMILGTADMLVVPNLTHGAAPFAYIENFVVDRDQRGRGFGRSLLEAAVERARAAGCYKVQLLSRNERSEAHELYGALGFAPSAQGFRRYL